MTRGLLVLTALAVALAGNPSRGDDSGKRTGFGGLGFTASLACAVPAIAKVAVRCDWSSVPPKLREKSPVPAKLREKELAQRKREKERHHLWVRRVTGLRDD